MEMRKTLMLLTGLCCASVCESQRHYILIRSPKSWAAAQTFCRETFTDLASFADMEEMQGALAAVQGGDDQEVWIGLSKGSTPRWHWSLTGTDLYREGEENHFIWGTVSDSNCAVFRDGKLHMSSCEDPRGAVCFDDDGVIWTPQDPTRQDGTRTKQGADRYVLIPQQTSWMAAQNFCRERHTDLTSLRNDAEYQKVEGVSEGQGIYVGLVRDPWEWSDRTESSLRLWRPTHTINTAYAETCVALLSGESGHWRDMDCAAERPFLCSYTMKALHFTKVKVRVQDATLDLNDPTVQESLLEQMKTELRKTTAGHFQLRWKTGSDGKVFTKQSRENPGNV